MKRVIVIGSGGHAKVVLDILEEMGEIEIIGITSKTLKSGLVFNNYPVIGDDGVLANFRNSDCLIAMGIGGYKDNNLREQIYNYVKDIGLTFLNVIHPSAIISKSVILGESVVIFSGVIINTDVKIGNNTIIATGSTIDHETIIGNHVLISAGVTIGAYSVINDNALLALGSKVISGINIGKGSLVAAGAVVVKNINDNERVFGIPASPK